MQTACPWRGGTRGGGIEMRERVDHGFAVGDSLQARLQQIGGRQRSRVDLPRRFGGGQALQLVRHDHISGARELV
jgi:hypothetical protein